jgi:hypothetical protein
VPGIARGHGLGPWDAYLLAGRNTLLEQAPLDDEFHANLA